MDAWSHEEGYTQKRACETIIRKVAPVTNKLTEKSLKWYGEEKGRRAYNKKNGICTSRRNETEKKKTKHQAEILL